MGSAGLARRVQLLRVRASDVRPLRHAVLRPHDPAHGLVLPRDDETDTAHFAFVDHTGRAVACATILQEGAPGAWRIRGVATAPELRGRGYGARVVGACVEHARAQGGRVAWLQTTPDVVPWYVKQGFRPEGDVFVIERGPRQKMVRTLA